MIPSPLSGPARPRVTLAALTPLQQPRAGRLPVLTVGFILGGTVGLGPVLYALSIGPLVQLFLPYLTVRLEITTS